MKFKNLQANYRERVVFTGVTGQLEPHQITMLLGQNGAGKSTLMTILGRLKKAQGQLECPESTLYLPQKNQLFDYLKVNDLLQLATTVTPATVSQIEQALELADLLPRDFLHLSSGQQQRVWLAYALLQDKDVILLDEPLNFLDLKYQQRLLKLLVELKQEEQRTFLLSIHDPQLAREYGDVIWLLDQKGLTTGQPEQLLTEQKVKEFFELQ